MLFASWEVCVAFSSPGSQFFTVWTDPKLANNIIIYFSQRKLGVQVGLFICNFVNELA